MLGVLLLLAAADPLTAPAAGPAVTCLIVGRQLEYKVASADVLLVLTEWQAFAQIDWPAPAAVMRRPAWLFDARAKADGAAARAAGLNVWTVGEGVDALILGAARRFSQMASSTTELLH